MKKTVLLFGLLSGLVITTFMVCVSMACYNNPDFESNMVLGYAGMLLSFSFVFIGIKNFRDKHNNGIITFGKAFKLGLFITLIASTVYVLVWLVEYYLFIPDFMESYSKHVVNEATRSGASAEKMEATLKEMNQMKEWYKNPLFVILLTYMEVLPIGLLLAIISALILKRKQNSNTINA